VPGTSPFAGGAGGSRFVTATGGAACVIIYA
jgi:hypothetical protein